MKTSRVARDTAKAIAPISQGDYAPPRQTRSFAASLLAFTANDLPLATPPAKRDAKSDNATSTTSAALNDIEDISLSTPRTSKKRKRNGMPSPSTGITSISTTTTIQSSPLKQPLSQDETAPPAGKVKKAKRQPAKRIVKENGEVSMSPPPNWEEIYSAVTEMRKARPAPVDTMGCENHMEDSALTPQVKRFHTLISLMLSSQTKDTTNALTMERLRRELPSPGLTLQTILECEPSRLNEIIWAVGFHNNKTRYIKAAAEILRDEYGGDIPDTVEGLMGLPGVGPKMAYLCLSAAWGRTEGIGVDVHVHRITNLWSWHKTNTPEETRASLEAWLPKEKWHHINHLLVGFGQTICLPVGRNCGDCTLASRGLCPSAVLNRKTQVKKVKKETVKVEKLVKFEEGDIEFKKEEEVVDG